MSQVSELEARIDRYETSLGRVLAKLKEDPGNTFLAKVLQDIRDDILNLRFQISSIKFSRAHKMG